jgi:site-specific recombinase XerD
MFDQLFERPHALARQRTGPLVEERQRFLVHQAERGMARRTLRDAALYLLIIARCLRLADRPGEVISRVEIERQAHLWANRSGTPKGSGFSRSRYRFRQYATRWLAFLGRLQPTAVPPPHPFAQEIAAFAEYLGREKGLAATTIDGRCLALGQFLGRLGSAGSLRRVTATQLDEVLIGQASEGRLSRRTVQDHASALRAFFRFAERRGWCPAGLAAAVKAPRVFAQESIPVGPSWDQVRQLLAQTEGDRPDDIRDRALLLLLAVYGLRAGEVVRLRLEDFDWVRELLTVTQSKSGRPRTYPLAGPVGVAVLRYLKEVRPRTTLREVFLARTAPRRPLHRCCLYVIVARRLRAVSPGLPRYGPHALRHACATHLLEQGLSLKEIGDHLGHRRPDTTRIYTKVDLHGLRQVADVELGGVL